MTRTDAPSHSPTARRYRSLAAFYTAEPRRIKSRELDVGLWWRDDARGPMHRAAWVADTGELYLVRLGPDTAGGGAVEVLATAATHEGLERALDGWREHCGEPRSLSWLRRRAAVIGKDARVEHGRDARLAARSDQTGRMRAYRVRPSSASGSQEAAESTNCR
jgi:hypothetical protein